MRVRLQFGAAAAPSITAAAPAAGAPFASLPERAGRAGSRRLWIVAFALPLLGLAAAGWWSLAAVRADFRAEMIRTLRLLDGHTLHVLQTQQVMLAAINARVSRLSWDEIRDRPDVLAFVRALMAASGTVDALGLASPDGHIAVAGEASRQPVWIDLSDRDFVSAFPAGTSRRASFVAVPVFSRVDGRPQVHLSAPRIAADGRADGGTVVAGFPPSLFERFFAAVAPSAHTGLILVRHDGTVLARFPVPISLQTSARLPLDHPAAAALTALPNAAPDTPQVVQVGSLLDGPHITAVTRIGDWPLLLIEEGDPHLLWARWGRMMAFPALGAAAAMALLAVLTARVRRTVALEQAGLRDATAAAEAARAASAERAALESRLRQVEKTAALGQLAAGVAHDFNNLLQAIVSGAEALQPPRPVPQEVQSAATMILKVVERGAALTRRMLDYARHDDQATEFPAGDALAGVAELLSHSLGVQHHLRLALPGGALPHVRAVKAEFETVIINLVVNARDAMPNGGEIVLGATVTATPPPGMAQDRAGPWLRVQVTDTGRGMDAETLARAGEAFFTTKPRGEGTGLGLSMARGYAGRAGGQLDLSSRPGQGTVVTLWLPAA